jgi:hypothetical protein
MTLEILPNSRAERLISSGNLRGCIFHRAFGRLQTADPVSIPVALAWLRPLFVIISPNRIACLALKRFFND